MGVVMSEKIEPLAESTVKSAFEVIVGAFGEEQAEAMSFLRLSLGDEKYSAFHFLDFLVLKKDNEVVGACGMFSMKWEPKDIAWLCYLAIKPEKQKHGLGTMLLKEVLLRAKNRGISRVYTDTSFVPNVSDATEFYKKNGFEDAGRLKDYPAVGEDTRYLVRRLD